MFIPVRQSPNRTKFNCSILLQKKHHKNKKFIINNIKKSSKNGILCEFNTQNNILRKSCSKKHPFFCITSSKIDIIDYGRNEYKDFFWENRFCFCVIGWFW
ncbi:MAG TPA: hypothetical protein DER23_09565 [Clostridiales bacterium]|nr:hypothetical protein [Clostridiales bacterium]